MTVYSGNRKIGEIYIGSKKIESIYKGNILVYSSKLPTGTVIFNNSTAGIYTVMIPVSQNYYIEIVGAGASGRKTGILSRKKYGGGSGAYIYGTQYIAKGSYTVEIGAGQSAGSNTNGGNSSFNGNVAGGGKGSGSSYTGGTYTTSLNGKNGNTGGQSVTANSVYDNTSTGYGAGGFSNTSGSKAGYVKIVAA